MTSVLVDKRFNQRVDVQLASQTSTDALTVRQVIMALGSLKFTVTLLAMTIVLVFAGTLAQVQKDIWQVTDEYFRTLITWIDLQLFFPPSFFPNRPQVSGGFYFPGGWLLGMLMTVNLLAAHGLRLKIQARGWPVAIGLAAIAMGVLLTTSIVVAGARYDGLRLEAWMSGSAAWRIFQATLVVAIGAMWFGVWRTEKRFQTQRRMLVAGSVVITVGFFWTLYRGRDGRLDDSSLRILWQLGKGTLAGLVLLGGCVLVFRRRAGVVLIHAGIAMLMLSELLVGLTAIESRMQIREGETVNYVQDIRNLELAVIDKSMPGQHDVVSVPESILRGKGIIRHEYLPFDIQVVQFMENARLQYAGTGTAHPTTSGVGSKWTAESLRPVSGTDTSGAINQSAAYLRLLDKHTAADLGTYLVASVLSSAELPEKVEVNGSAHYLYLRFKQTYKPYALTLVDVRKDDYPGTDTPRNYSSDVRLVDASGNVDRETKIWMNNPLRFSGETFYQSGYFRDPETRLESTTLSVVSNQSWMLPYVACMIVATGMLAHFGVALLRFLQNRSVTSKSLLHEIDLRSALSPPPESRRVFWLSWCVPVVIVLVLGGWIGSKALSAPSNRR